MPSAKGNPWNSSEARTKLGKNARSKMMKNIPALGKLTSKVQERVKQRNAVTGLDGRSLNTRSSHAALNTLIQGAGAIIMKKALVILDDSLQDAGYRPGVDYEFILNVHDEFGLEVTIGYEQDIAVKARNSIVQAGEHFNFRCSLDGEALIGDSWKETH